MSSNEKFDREFEEFLSEENSRLAALYRKLPRPEPDARLDAAVHAMAHRALNPQLVATPRPESRRRRSGRWLPALGAAAGVVLAAGIAFKLDPSARSDRNESGTPASDVITVRQLDAPPPLIAPPLSPPPPAANPGGSNAVSPAPAKPAASKAAEFPAAVKEQEAKASGGPVVEAERSTLAGLKKAGNVEAVPSPAQPFPAAVPRQRHQTVDPEKRIQEIAAGRWVDPYDRKLDEAARAAARRPNPPSAQPQAATQATTAARPTESLQYAPSGLATTAAAPAPPAARSKSAVANPPENRPEASAASTDASSAGNVLSDDARHRESNTRDSGSSGKAVPAEPQSVQSDKLEQDAFPAPATLRDAPEAVQREDGKAKQRPRSNDPNARLYPEHWLANIRTMLHERRHDEALRSLGEFRKIYPDYHLPDDLRDLK